MASATTMVALGASGVSCFAVGATLALQLMGGGSRKKGARKKDIQRRRKPDYSPSPSDGDASSDSDESMVVSQRSPQKKTSAEQARKRLDSERTLQMSSKYMTAGWEGFSMEDAKMHANKFEEKHQTRTPREVLADLQKGNVRFWTGVATRPEKSAFERRVLIAKQFPATAILGCSDSRVPTEIVFDQGLGDMFVIRVAGNCLDVATTASLQYAVSHLEVKVVVVMGHEGCGAVKAAAQPVEALEREPEALSKLLKALKRSLDLGRLDDVQDSRARDRESVVTNVRKQIEKLQEDPSIMKKVNDGDLIIVGAFYEISSGIVDFPFELSNTSKSVVPGAQNNIPGVQFRI